MTGPTLILILIVAQPCRGRAWVIRPALPAAVTPLAPRNEIDTNKKENIVTELSTCGYLDGDANKPRTANAGYNCRVDTLHGLWGFCPTTVIYATDCGLGGGCLDNYSCASVCGPDTGNMQLTTWTW